MITTKDNHVISANGCSIWQPKQRQQKAKEWIES